MGGGILSFRKSDWLEAGKIALETLENLGYYNKIYRLNAQNFGIPQKRETNWYS